MTTEAAATGVAAPPSAPTVLSPSQSWALLREAVVGRLAVVVDGRPDIFPVNYVVDHGSIVFRTAQGTKLTGAAGRSVAFEVDSFDPAGGAAWSVVVAGTAVEVTRLHDVVDALGLPLFAWHPAPQRCIVRIEPDTVTGRRFDAPPPGPGPSARRAAHE